MTNMEISLLVLVPLMALVLMLPILMGMYVYRDAKARRMDAVLWTLVVVLVPSFIGLIIYLVIRGNHTNLNCPACGQPVSAEYALCPHCGARLKTACPACGTPAESGWKLCSKCGTELPETQDAIYPPAAPQKDGKLMRIIVAAVLIPILLFVVGVAALGVSNFSRDHDDHMMSAGTNRWLEDAPAHIAGWAATCDEQGKGVYVFQQKSQAGDAYTAYVYMNENKGEGNSKGFYGKAELVDQDRVVEWRYTTISTGHYAPDKVTDYELSVVETQGFDIEGIRIIVDGMEVEAVVTE